MSEGSYVFPLTGQHVPVLTKRLGNVPPCESGDDGGEGKKMYEIEKILAVIGSAIDLARRNPKPGEPVSADDYVAWVIVNELRRAGFRIVPPPPQNISD